MGQYYKIVNLDKQECLDPHDFHGGAKLVEMMSSLATCALTLLLADGNGLGGGDFGADSPRIGSWAGDRIVIVGDYAESKLYHGEYTNISADMIRVLAAEEFYREWLEEAFEDDPAELERILAGG